MKPKLLILGAGGHGRTVAEAAIRSGQFELLGFLDPGKKGQSLDGVPVLGGDDDLEPYLGVSFVVGLGSVGDPSLRVALFERAISAGLVPARILHPSSTLASKLVIGEGSFVAPGCVIDPGVTVGRNVILNVGAIICHDSTVGDHVHLSPGSVLCGRVTIEDQVHVGAGATVLQGVVVHSGAIIGAGAVVIGDVAPRCTVVGVPARVISSSSS